MAQKTGRGAAAMAGIAFGLAAGVAAGTYLLAPNLPGGQLAQEQTLTTERDAAKLEVEVANAQAASADTFIKEVAPTAVRGTLEQRQVLILRTADASEEDYEGLRALLREAGAGDSGTITLEDKFFSQDGADELKSLITNTLPAGVQLSVDRLDSGTHAGESLGSALALNPENGQEQASSEDRAIILGALSDAGFISYATGTILPAQSIILLTGNNGSPEAAFAAENQANFARALDSRGGNVVVAGRVFAAGEQGTLALLRENANAREDVSTVDSVDRAWAQVATVLAVREQLEGRSGAYGTAASAEAVAPALPTTDNN
ncbi:copper transporter [Corynebacterium sp. 153RC1]|uniref:copper transporter n=1 Tax=unclassified Corynebacterium TaxID=2624378 RepID=UPI00211D0288|nr:MULTISPECIES: copper transporter [unclassified Corynebacterium]MCQ9353404.1 copper transporter [Corynebacterium sp. 209RC1]MCQ9355626.1 copper transporter [Corynebacterium sp. 1222RC1]MCQ9357808.1 copper transporter [Corynebacterium sp. 122RC1]MCQ9360003.1 copper transporter [Corynebacterium sp. 142RC1]MCQ9362147.1 copper transporter [Corynebacterium sp. 153RC1]